MIYFYFSQKIFKIILNFKKSKKNNYNPLIMIKSYNIKVINIIKLNK